MNGDISGLVFSLQPIMHTYYILSVLFIGYFLYLLLIKNRRTDTELENIKEIEAFLIVLAFGLLVVVGLNGSLILTGTKGLILGPFYQVMIVSAAFFILLYHIFHISDCKLILCSLILLIIIPLLTIIILPQIGHIDKCGPVKMPFVSNETIEKEMGLNQKEYCFYECYTNYRANFSNIDDNIVNNTTGFHCFCNVFNCIS